MSAQQPSSASSCATVRLPIYHRLPPVTYCKSDQPSYDSDPNICENQTELTKILSATDTTVDACGPCTTITSTTLLTPSGSQSPITMINHCTVQSGDLGMILVFVTATICALIAFLAYAWAARTSAIETNAEEHQPEERELDITQSANLVDGEPAARPETRIQAHPGHEAAPAGHHFGTFESRRLQDADHEGQDEAGNACRCPWSPLAPTRACWVTENELREARDRYSALLQPHHRSRRTSSRSTHNPRVAALARLLNRHDTSLEDLDLRRPRLNAHVLPDALSNGTDQHTISRDSSYSSDWTDRPIESDDAVLEAQNSRNTGGEELGHTSIRDIDNEGISDRSAPGSGHEMFDTEPAQTNGSRSSSYMRGGGGSALSDVSIDSYDSGLESNDSASSRTPISTTKDAVSRPSTTQRYISHSRAVHLHPMLRYTQFRGLVDHAPRAPRSRSGRYSHGKKSQRVVTPSKEASRPRPESSYSHEAAKICNACVENLQLSTPLPQHTERCIACYSSFHNDNDYEDDDEPVEGVHDEKDENPKSPQEEIEIPSSSTRRIFARKSVSTETSAQEDAAPDQSRCQCVEGASPPKQRKKGGKSKSAKARSSEREESSDQPESSSQRKEKSNERFPDDNTTLRELHDTIVLAEERAARRQQKTDEILNYLIDAQRRRQELCNEHLTRPGSPQERGGGSDCANPGPSGMRGKGLPEDAFPDFKGGYDPNLTWESSSQSSTKVQPGGSKLPNKKTKGKSVESKPILYPYVQACRSSDPLIPGFLIRKSAKESLLVMVDHNAPGLEHSEVEIETVNGRKREDIQDPVVVVKLSRNQPYARNPETLTTIPVQEHDHHRNTSRRAPNFRSEHHHQHQVFDRQHDRYDKLYTNDRRTR